MHRVWLFVLALVAAPAGAQWVKTADWNSQPLIGGIAAAPSDPNRVYAFDGVGSLLVSDDSGLTWRRRPAPSNGGTIMLAVDPIERDTLYLTMSGLDPALFKSTDGGATFTNLGAFDYFAIDPNDHNVLYAAPSDKAGGGIRKSVDGGTTWQDTSSTGGAHAKLAVDPNDSQTVYAGGCALPLTQHSCGVYRTRDGGASWSRISEGYDPPTFIAVDAASRPYVVVFSLLYRQGARIIIDTMPGPSAEGPNQQLTAVVPDPRRDQTIYASTVSFGVLVSYDDAAHWQSLGQLPEYTIVNGMAVTGNGVVLAATVNGVYRITTAKPRRRVVR